MRARDCGSQGAEPLAQPHTCSSLNPDARCACTSCTCQPHPNAPKGLGQYVKHHSATAMENKMAWKAKFFQYRKIINNHKNLKFSWDTAFRMLIIINGSSYFSDTKVDQCNQWLCTKSLDLPKNIYDLLDNNMST